MFTMQLVEYYANQITTEMVLCVSLLLNYYLFSKLSSVHECMEELRQDYDSLEEELDNTKRHVKFYKYCFNTQKKAEKVYKKEISNLKLKLVTQERKYEEETKKRSHPPPFTMSLRERDENGNVKRRKTSSETE